MIKRVVNFFCSLRLTVALLGLALILVFIGTMAQVKLGLYAAQEEYFRSLFIFWQPNGASWKIPIFPGGWLLGGLLLVNLISAHIKRFNVSKKKIGIFLIHGGLIFLLLGQFFTEVFQVESNIRFEEGETRNYSEDTSRTEVVFVDTSDPENDKVVAVPEALLAKGGEILLPGLPFSIRVKDYFPNSQTAGPVSEGGKKINATTPAGEKIWFSQMPMVAAMDSRNVPAVLMEIVSDKGPAVERIASLWLNGPQRIEVDGRSFQMSLRSTRYYTPYTLSLLDFRHDLYQGTSKPKNFSSKVHLTDSRHGEDREVLIRMNEPLRYAGLTYFQASFDPNNDRVTILQVVRNPAALTPYISCTLIGLGLLVQFLSHLVGFGRREKKKAAIPVSAPVRKPAVRVSEEKEVA